VTANSVPLEPSVKPQVRANKPYRSDSLPYDEDETCGENTPQERGHVARPVYDPLHSTRPEPQSL